MSRKLKKGQAVFYLWFDTCAGRFVPFIKLYEPGIDDFDQTISATYQEAEDKAGRLNKAIEGII